MKNESSFDIFSSLNREQLKCLKEIQNTFSDLQCAWLSGYFWSIANKNSFSLPLEKKEFHKDNSITILSASQTGNAKLLSERLNQYLKKNDKKTNLINASDYKFKKINFEKILILIISTQGDGEPPEEALSFYKYIMSIKAPKLDNVYYSIFALGDTSYNLFCQSGKDFDKRFQELGAKFLIKRLDVDIEYENDYQKWSCELLHSINKIEKSLDFSISSLKNQGDFTKSSLNKTKKTPILGTVLINQKITGRNSIKDVHHIEIDISDLNVHYTPGDALGVWYKNDSNLVNRVLKLLSINTLDKVRVNNKNTTVFNALQNNFELTNNTKNLVKDYAILTQNKFLKKIVSNDEKLQNYVIQTPFVNMIHDYPSSLTSKELISLLRPLKPRLYSISSSQEEEPNEVHITVRVIKKIISGYVHFGGASGYLSQRLKIDDKLKIFIESNNNFRLPSDKNISIIMIGSGTGIAPFRSFMQQRDNDGSQGKNWIFFGNTNFTEDFLYQIDWQQYMKKGLLNKISLAWSQDQKRKIYIQDKIRENGKKLWSWIENGAQIYVCGNASRMAKDVEKALIDIISENSNMNLESSNEFLNNLRINKRYQRDVY